MLKISGKLQEALNDVNILVITGFANGRDQLKTTLQNNFNANIYFGIFFIIISISTLKKCVS